MNIRHDEVNREFYADFPEGKASLHYECDGDVLNFHHTFVPPELRGKGIAEKLVESGFDFVEKNHLKAIPSCPYVARLVMKNANWKRFIVQS